MWGSYRAALYLFTVCNETTGKNQNEVFEVFFEFGIKSIPFL